nr:hypothetical protein GCM10020093_069100 [Planobispora longispora]
MLGLGTVVGGSIAPKVIGRIGARSTLVAGGLVQAVFTVALLGLGDDRSWMWLLLAATFAGGVGNMLVIVAFMVTATSGLPDREQGLATGLATMTQQIGITMGTPIMSAIAASAIAGTGTAAMLGGLKAAIAVNAAIVLLGVLTSLLFLDKSAPAPAGAGREILRRALDAALADVPPVRVVSLSGRSPS